MLRSMTGYGRSEYLSNDRRFKVEVKSVNHRYGDINIKLPRFLNPLEDRIRKRLARDIIRGKADVYINFESFTAQDIRVNINFAFADAYEQAMRALADRYELPDGVTLELLTSHPDVFNIEKTADDKSVQEELWETLSHALEQALSVFNTMRETEGIALYKDISSRGIKAAELVSRIKTRAPEVASEYQVRLYEKVTEALEAAGASIDEGRILTEVAVFADRAAIDEEITRMESHLAQLSDILDESANVGRKLDFLVQEMNREANTIGSKSNDITVTKLVVELKSEIEKIREQVQNIE